MSNNEYRFLAYTWVNMNDGRNILDLWLKVENMRMIKVLRSLKQLKQASA
jgi:hypothetical protein